MNRRKYPSQSQWSETKRQSRKHSGSRRSTKPIRDQFEKRLRDIIKKEDVEVIAEKAGDDTAVWEQLKQEDEACGDDLAELFGGKTVEAPVSTIATQIADERPGELEHVDIRAPNAAEMSIEQRDETMVAKVMELLGTADSAVVIVGEDHRAGVAQRISEKDLAVKSVCFP